MPSRIFKPLIIRNIEEGPGVSQIVLLQLINPDESRRMNGVHVFFTRPGVYTMEDPPLHFRNFPKASIQLWDGNAASTTKMTVVRLECLRSLDFSSEHSWLNSAFEPIISMGWDEERSTKISLLHDASFETCRHIDLAVP
jgi:hypothetical protein